MSSAFTVSISQFFSGERKKQHFLLRPSVIVGLLYILFFLFMARFHGFSILSYVHLGRVSHTPNTHTAGYDGQFFYYIAQDPLHAAWRMDNAPYRYQRILYPMLVYLLSLGGMTALIPWVLLLVNFFSIVLATEFVARLLCKHQLSPWFSLPIGLYYGQTTAFVFDTTEPIAYFFVCLGFLLLANKKTLLAAIAMGLGCLCRETAILFPLGYVAILVLNREWRNAFIFGLISLVPLPVWYLCLQFIFGSTGLGYAPSFEPIPFQGLFVFQGNSRFLPLLILMFVPTVLNILYILIEVRHNRWKTATWISWLLNLLLVIFMSRLSYVELVSAGRLSTGLVIAMVFHAWYTRNNWLLWMAMLYTLTFPIYIYFL